MQNIIRFRLKVIRITHEEFCWKIIGFDLNENVERRYICKYLCIATSYCRIPFIPLNLQKFFNYFQGKILLIGGGHSSSEISTELTDKTSSKCTHSILISGSS